jgi:cyclopropane-fatty-acyl-phospholipid synthase
MSLIDLCERGLLPDFLTRFGIRRLCKERLRDEYAGDWKSRQQQFVQTLKASAVAIETQAANEQHYEVPPPFFVASLGKRLKYSSCFYPKGTETLDQAEEAMLALYGERAELADGMRILELGCGWGSLSLWMAQKYPNAKITGVSNSKPQREFILARALERGLHNLEIITCDVNQLSLETNQFDRCVSIEMFEHMRNYDILLERISSWLKTDGKLFVHIFCHREIAYPFEVKGKSDWMSQYFFTGGIMPAFDTFRQFDRHLRIEADWKVSGQHYEKTSNHWLAAQDQNKAAIMETFKQCYGADQATIWFQRWRMFYMACAELFGMQEGKEWLVGHYRFSKVSANS